MSNMKAQSLTFLLLGLLCVGASSPQSIVFSREVLLLVDGHGGSDPAPIRPVVQILSDPQQGVLVCLVSGLRAGPVLISWRVDTTAPPGPPLRPPGPQLLWTQAHHSGTYSASSVWTRNETAWRTSAWLCCGATQARPAPGPALEGLEPDLETCCHGECGVQT